MTLSDRERELVNPYYVIVAEDEVLAPDPGEITEGRFWHVDEIKANVGRDVFTPNFENEFELIKDYIK